jgi:hypothetical protein
MADWGLGPRGGWIFLPANTSPPSAAAEALKTNNDGEELRLLMIENHETTMILGKDEKVDVVDGEKITWWAGGWASCRYFDLLSNLVERPARNRPPPSWNAIH